ncbi:hypothetical protein BGZ57DRAFT_753162, partial [Hyaloscypha finlandica]
LGLRCLWINFLCIIQNEAQEWEQKSATVGQVYSRGFLNIAAPSSSDGSGRCCVQHLDLNENSHVRLLYQDKIRILPEKS